MAQCVRCGLDIGDGAAFCSKCGTPQQQHQPPAPPPNHQVQPQYPPARYPAPMIPVGNAPGERPWLGGQIVAMIGALMVGVGPLLPWATAGALSASGLQKTNGEATALILLGIVGLVGMLVAVLQRKRTRWIGATVLGLISGAVALFYYGVISDQMDEVNAKMEAATGEPGIAQIGAGLYVCIAGAVIMVFGALAMHAKPRR